MLPQGACTFVGLGYIGCDGTPELECRAWLNGGFWDKPQAIVHEISHNLWLGHAGSVNSDGSYDQYNDPTCAMGYCCANRCFNTPHAWQLGWVTVRQLDGSSLAAGQTITTTLASQAVSTRSGVRIVPSWVAGVDPIFLGYRTQAGGDAELGPDAAQLVHVYSSPISGTFDSSQTTKEASLAGAHLCDLWLPICPPARPPARPPCLPAGCPTVTRVL